ncbi:MULTISPECIES: formyltransferase family protein [unclassified Pseudomonas]|uniref:formyltransferase family protein n=1 Tax=unclassified Pseudomonas TaxID=196821 RepID=UPI000D371E34|nr:MULTISPECIES: formyltransferase family protein [unclassified Pseudomonas]RAU39499.1 N(5)-hydroxyornithine transformylase PvdF [Pseudomonas sp. RIT 409]RAU55121.1 N(5)-hydroxyornithine transformylase PvdF [Pseudomonas sp. RIT 412]
MQKTKLVYVLSLRNGAADKAGQYVDYRGEKRYMKSPLEHLVQALNETPLGDHYSLEGVIFDDNPESARDRESIKAYGFGPGQGEHWLYPADLSVQGRLVTDLLENVPSTYRALPLGDSQRPAGKSDFERRLGEGLRALEAEVVVLDGLLVILDELVRPGADFHRRIVNIHPGITRLESPYERRGAYATLDALYGAKGKKVIDWTTRETVDIPVVDMTGASFHYVDNGIDSGEVIFDVLDTPIAPEDTILELRWNNFNNSLFPALEQGLLVLARRQPH